MEFILLVALVVVYATLNGRLRRVEALLYKDSTTHVAATMDPVPAVTTVTESAPVVTPVAVQVVPALDAAQRAEHSEEQGARWLGRFGFGLLFLGLVFFLKYAFDNWIGPMGQVIIVALIGAAIFALGDWLRAKYRGYGLALMGGGAAVMYLAFYAGYAFLGVLSLPVAFALMCIITVCTLGFAVTANGFPLAIAAVVGAFATPLLLSTGTNELLTLSIYMLVIDVGVLAVSYYRKWLALNFVAFAGTTLLFMGWFSVWYSDTQLALTFILATTFFVVFLAMSIMHHVARNEGSNEADMFFVLVNPAIYFGFVHAMLYAQYDYIEGYFALLLAVCYALIAKRVYDTSRTETRLFAILAGVALMFLTAAIPLQLSGVWITYAWLFEAVILLAIGAREQLRALLLGGWIVLVLGYVRVGYDMVFTLMSGDRIAPFWNTQFLELVIAILVTYSIVYIFVRHAIWVPRHKVVAVVMVFLATALTVLSVNAEIDRYFGVERVAIHTAAQQRQSEAYNTGTANNWYDTYYRNYTAEELQALNANTYRQNVVTNIVWALYALLHLVIGFTYRIRMLRILGLVGIFIVMIKVVTELWALGQLYRIIISVLLGVLALGASFLYAKYKDRLRALVNE